MKTNRNILAAVLLGILAACGSVWGNDQPVREQPEARTKLIRQLTALKQEYRLRTRALVLLTEVALFDDGAMRVREAKGNSKFTTDEVVSQGAGFETVGIGGRAPEAGGTVSELEALKEEIAGLQRRLGKE